MSHGAKEYGYDGLFSVMYDFVDVNIKNPSVKGVIIKHLKFIENRVNCKKSFKLNDKILIVFIK